MVYAAVILNYNIWKRLCNLAWSTFFFKNTTEMKLSVWWHEILYEHNPRRNKTIWIIYLIIWRGEKIFVGRQFQSFKLILFSIFVHGLWDSVSSYFLCHFIAISGNQIKIQCSQDKGDHSLQQLLFCCP